MPGPKSPSSFGEFRLAADFYRPVRLAALHFRLYPDEFFNPVSSPNRVHRAINRFRGWCEEAGAPFDIEESGGAYRLTAKAPAAILVPRPERETGAVIFTLDTLRQRFQGKPFSAPQVSEILGTSISSAQRLLRQAYQEGKLERCGKARATRYKLVA